MKIKLSELRHLVRKSLAKIYEDYEVGADGSVDLKNPVVLWNNTYDMSDQETMTKVANRRTNLNEPDPKDEDEVDKAIRTLMGSGMGGSMRGEGKKNRKKDSNGCETPFAIDKYAKKKSRYHEMRLIEAVPPQFLKKNKDKDDDKPKKKMPPPFDKKAPKPFGKKKSKSDADDKPGKKKKKQPWFMGKKDEAKYPDKDGWQGETYRDPDRRTKPSKKKKPKLIRPTEAKYPDKDGWQGETYRDPDRRTKPSKKKKPKLIRPSK